jgi:colanic acid/amylovoran biosynthesis glycosyltransferase
MLAQHPEIAFHYDLIGDGPLAPSLRAQIKAAGLSDRVRMHGSLPHATVQKILGESDVFVLPSVTAADGDQEGIPVALMEAMASGMPVVATRHSGIPELVEDGRSGYLVPERDSAALRAALVKLARERDTWTSLGRHGRRKIEQEFDLKTLLDQLVAIYREQGPQSRHGGNERRAGPVQRVYSD